MSKAELLFKSYLDKLYPDGFIHKIADFKQLGSGGNKGLPDFLVINHGYCFWYEVKYTKSLRSFNLNEIREHQWIVFNKMLNAGTDVSIIVYDGDYRRHVFTFSEVLFIKKNGQNKIVF